MKRAQRLWRDCDGSLQSWLPILFDCFLEAELTETDTLEGSCDVVFDMVGNNLSDMTENKNKKKTTKATLC